MRQLWGGASAFQGRLHSRHFGVGNKVFLIFSVKEAHLETNRSLKKV